MTFNCLLLFSDRILVKFDRVQMAHMSLCSNHYERVFNNLKETVVDDIPAIVSFQVGEAPNNHELKECEDKGAIKCHSCEVIRPKG